MNFIPPNRCLLAALVLLFASSARAHPGHFHPGIDEIDEFEKQHALQAGLIHPLTGWDHLLPLLAMGCTAGLAARSRMGAPAAFASGVLLGGGIFAGAIPLPVFHVVCLAVMVTAAWSVALRRPLPSSLTLMLAGTLGICQGQAQVVMIPHDNLIAPYLVGFVAAGFMPLGLGMMLGKFVRRRLRAPFAGVLSKA
ncbi:MAG TPA: HupE/UreJ family protein [Verrucomicrobiaceae bacterium]